MAALTIELDRSTLETVIGALADKHAALRRRAAAFRAADNLAAAYAAADAADAAAAAYYAAYADAYADAAADVARLERVLQQLESERTRLAHSRYLK
jgi:hypothetical protein